jgi:hypothetical protein
MPTVTALWRGEMPLPRAVWLYGVAGSLIFAFPVNLVTLGGGGAGGSAFLFYSFCLLVYTGLVCVGMWKSASRYEGTWFFPFITKFSVGVVCCIITYSLVTPLAT